MEIALVSAGMPFGPNTLDSRSLGGSETAALQVSKEMAKLGHFVTIFCNLPPVGREDHWVSGAQSDEGVRWVGLDQYVTFITATEVDVLIVSRSPQFLAGNVQAKKIILWVHDLATHNPYKAALMQESYKIDEIWCLTEFHKEQFHSVVGYPKDHIKVTRNGIVKFGENPGDLNTLLDVPNIPRTLLYSARPERGLEMLVRPGGIMEQLPEFTLKVTMYENYPEHMMDYYNQLWARCNLLPNVELLGCLTQLQLRQLMKSTWAYVYPTVFEEVSCILGREAIEQGLPFITTSIGALPETIGECGVFVPGDKDEIGSEAWLKLYSDTVRELDGNEARYNSLVSTCLERGDLYWDEVAQQWLNWCKPRASSHYTILSSLIKDSDIIPAFAYAAAMPTEEITKGSKHLIQQLESQYPFVTGERTFEEYYQGIYEHEDSKNVIERQEMRTLRGSPRYNEIAHHIEKLPPGSKVIDYGCAEGPIILGLAQDFPDRTFIGIDFVGDNISLCRKYSADNNLSNVEFYTGSTDNWPDGVTGNCAIISEVLEHVIEPWKVTDVVEQHIEAGGPILITVPQGSWEWGGLQNMEQWDWRAHIWHINKKMMRHCWGHKPAYSLNTIANSFDRSGRKVGHLTMAYACDKELANPMDPLEKIEGYIPRQTLAVCMIAMNDEDRILYCLNSFHKDTDQLHIALGPSSDNTEKYIREWHERHPWVELYINDVPRIQSPSSEDDWSDGYGFDDARNASIKDVDADWILWIDSDEYLSGESITSYLRDNCFDSYAIHQHHFTCQPRGEPAQLDKPARLMRKAKGYQFFGKVHEHAEIGFNEGPGFVFLLGDVDIGHTGYINDVHRKDRFIRNFPLLKWDRVAHPDRKLGKYLWLRDLVQRIDVHKMNNDNQGARRLAEEAVSFYKDHMSDISWIAGGPTGSNNANAFYGKALQFLGRGKEIGVQIQFEDNVANYNGIFENQDEALKVANEGLKEQFELRASGYWQ